MSASNGKLQPDKFALVRQAATSMAACALLTVIGSSPMVPYLAFIFLCFSGFFLVTASFQLWAGFTKFCEHVRKLGDTLSFAFMLVALVSILRNWSIISDRLRGERVIMNRV